MENALTRTANGAAVAVVEHDYNEGIILEDPIQMSQALRAEVDVQISTAKRFPRSIRNFKQQALEMATFDEETASGCFYSLPRGGKPIEGPSARLAEIVLSAWGNVRSEARIIGVDDKEITAEAMTWDLEKNVAIRVQVKRRITDKYGKRYSDDMVTVTGNAACSIALRNSVFKVIPMVYTKSIYQAARQVAIGDIKTIAAKRVEMVDYFGKMGITPDRVFAAIGKGFIEEIGLDELATLKGVATAIKDGDVSVDEAFPPIQKDGPAGVNGLRDRLNKTAEKSEEVEAPVETPVAEDQTVGDTKTSDEPTETDESRFETLKVAIDERLAEMGKEDAKKVLNGRKVSSFDLKQAEAFWHEITAS